MYSTIKGSISNMKKQLILLNLIEKKNKDKNKVLYTEFAHGNSCDQFRHK